jgi:hypothetical protein
MSRPAQTTSTVTSAVSILTRNSGNPRTSREGKQWGKFARPLAGIEEQRLSGLQEKTSWWAWSVEICELGCGGDSAGVIWSMSGDDVLSSSVGGGD